MTEGDPYVYPGTLVLRNRLGIKNYKKLERMERSMAGQRISEGVPEGKFDLAHLQAIHRHLFQDIYDRAGELRTVEINKGGHQFQFRQYIRTGMADVHRRLVQSKFLVRLSRHDFSQEVAVIIGDFQQSTFQLSPSGCRSRTMLFSRSSSTCV